MSASSFPEKKKVVLRSSNGVSFEVEEEVAILSQTIKEGMKDGWEEGGLPLPTIDTKTLALVIDYSKKHTGNSEGLEAWDADFIKVDRDTLFDIIKAANFLNIKGLMDLACQSAANRIKGKSPAGVRNFFNISNSFTAEEDEEVKRENQWAFE